MDPNPHPNPVFFSLIAAGVLLKKDRRNFVSNYDVSISSSQHFCKNYMKLSL